MSTAVVYKYPIKGIAVTITLPADAEVLKVAVQDGNPVMWVKLDPAAQTVYRRFEVHRTGRTIPEAGKRSYVDTFFFGPFVSHVFEVTA